jgi:hypothetical protein
MSNNVCLLMTFVILVMAPLIVIPCREMIEGRLGTRMTDDNRQRQLLMSTQRQNVVRIPFCLTCMVLLELVPNGFVHLLRVIYRPSLFCLQLLRRASTDGVFLCKARSFKKDS